MTKNRGPGFAIQHQPMKVTQAKMCMSHIPENGGMQQLCGRLENALALEGESPEWTQGMA